MINYPKNRDLIKVRCKKCGMVWLSNCAQICLSLSNCMSEDLEIVDEAIEEIKI